MNLAAHAHLFAVLVTAGGAICAVLAASSGCSVLVTTDDLASANVSDANHAGDSNTASDSHDANEHDAHSTETNADANDSAADTVAEESPSVNWCKLQSPHTICSDFDEGSITAGWTAVIGSDPLLLDTTASTSKPASLQATILPFAATSATMHNAMLKTLVPLATKSVHVEADVLFKASPTAPSNGSLNLLHFGQTNSIGNDSYVHLQVSSAETAVVIYLPGGEGYRTFTIPAFPGGWFHLKIDFELGASKKVAVQYDATPPFEVGPMQTLMMGAAELTLHVGLEAFVPAGSTPGGSINYDNLIVDLK
ncbi:MAG: hypothetical protein NVS3B20_08050 [Polyangiales bacterium]